MIYLLLIVAVIIVVCIIGSHQTNKEREIIEAAKAAACHDGAKAGEEDRGEHTCPYQDGPDPGNMPVAVAAITDDGSEKGKRYWWLLAYRTSYRNVFANPNSPAFQAGMKAFESGSQYENPWKISAVDASERIAAKNWQNGYENGVKNKTRDEGMRKSRKLAYEDGVVAGKNGREVRDLVGYLASRGWLGVADSWKDGYNSGCGGQKINSWQ